MKNFVQEGDTLTLIAPAGGVTSGSGFLVGLIFAVASTTAAAGESVEGVTEGVFTLKAEGAGSGQAFAVGDAVYWDNTAKQCTKTSAGNTKIGVATAAKLTADVLVTVRLNAVF